MGCFFCSCFFGEEFHWFTLFFTISRISLAIFLPEAITCPRNTKKYFSTFSPSRTPLISSTPSWASLFILTANPAPKVPAKSVMILKLPATNLGKFGGRYLFNQDYPRPNSLQHNIRFQFSPPILYLGLLFYPCFLLHNQQILDRGEK